MGEEMYSLLEKIYCLVNNRPCPSYQNDLRYLFEFSSPDGATIDDVQDNKPFNRKKISLIWSSKGPFLPFYNLKKNLRNLKIDQQGSNSLGDRTE